jgi:hypothetical protein
MGNKVPAAYIELVGASSFRGTVWGKVGRVPKPNNITCALNVGNKHRYRTVCVLETVPRYTRAMICRQARGSAGGGVLYRRARACYV